MPIAEARKLGQGQRYLSLSIGSHEMCTRDATDTPPLHAYTLPVRQCGVACCGSYSIVDKEKDPGSGTVAITSLCHRMARPPTRAEVAAHPTGSLARRSRPAAIAFYPSLPRRHISEWPQRPFTLERAPPVFPSQAPRRSRREQKGRAMSLVKR